MQRRHTRRHADARGRWYHELLAAVACSTRYAVYCLECREGGYLRGRAVADSSPIDEQTAPVRSAAHDQPPGEQLQSAVREVERLSRTLEQFQQRLSLLEAQQPSRSLEVELFAATNDLLIAEERIVRSSSRVLGFGASSIVCTALLDDKAVVLKCHTRASYQWSSFEVARKLGELHARVSRLDNRARIVPMLGYTLLRDSDRCHTNSQNATTVASILEPCTCSLAQLLSAATSEQGGISVGEVLHIALDVARAVALVHASGLAFNGITTSNVLLDESLHARLALSLRCTQSIDKQARDVSDVGTVLLALQAYSNRLLLQQQQRQEHSEEHEHERASLATLDKCIMRCFSTTKPATALQVAEWLEEQLARTLVPAPATAATRRRSFQYTNACIQWRDEAGASQ